MQLASSLDTENDPFRVFIVYLPYETAAYFMQYMKYVLSAFFILYLLLFCSSTGNYGDGYAFLLPSKLTYALMDNDTYGIAPLLEGAIGLAPDCNYGSDYQTQLYQLWNTTGFPRPDTLPHMYVNKSTFQRLMLFQGVVYI